MHDHSVQAAQIGDLYRSTSSSPALAYARPLDLSLGEALAAVDTGQRALLRHAMSGNIESLRHLVALRDALDERIRRAGVALHRCGVPLTDLADLTGCTQRAARSRYGIPARVELFGDLDARPTPTRPCEPSGEAAS